MATSGTLNSSAYQGRYISLTWSATQDVANNRSTISWTLKGAGNSSQASWYMAGGFKVVIDGATVYSVSTDSRIKLYNGTTVASGTKVISHNGDGTRSFNAYIEAGIYTFAVNCTGSGSFILDTIPRATTPTLSASTVDMGSSVTITLNRASSEFTHNVYYQFGGSEGTIGTGVGTSKSWTPPLSLANKIPNARLGTGTIVVDTYKGSTYIGCKTCSITLRVPENDSTRPTVNLSVSEAVATVSSKLGVYVKDLSKLSITVTGESKLGASNASYKIIANGSSYSTATVTTELLKASGLMTISATVTDSRGIPGTATTVIDVKDYIKPYANSFSVVRCTADGTESDEGGNIKATYSLGVTDITGNTPTYKLSYKKKSDANYTDIILATSGSTLSGSRIVTGIDTDYSYDVKITVTDQFNETAISTLIGTGYTLIDFNYGGRGIALGKVSEADGLDVNLDTRFRKAVRSEGDVIAGLDTANPASLQSVFNMATKLYTTNNLAPLSICIPVNAPAGSSYFRCFCIGNLSDTSDKYYLLIDYYGKLFVGLQLNGASTITWYEK